MRTARFWLGFILLLVLPATANAQHHRGEHRGLTGAVEKLYEHREQLGMTAEQLARVQEIKDTADARKQPLWQQIMTIRHDLKARQKAEPGMPEAERAAMVKRGGEEIELLLGQIREIDKAASRQVGSVLTPGQKEIIREIVSRSRRDRNRSGQSRERARDRD